MTLTITPDAGYELSSITVYITDGSGNVVGSVVIPLSGTGATRTFVMPAHHVAIVATFTTLTGFETLLGYGQLKAFVQHGTVYISGVAEGKTVRVYSVLGVQVATFNSPKGGDLSAPLPSRGIYIVTDGDRQLKIVN